MNPKDETLLFYLFESNKNNIDTERLKNGFS